MFGGNSLYFHNSIQRVSLAILDFFNNIKVVRKRKQHDDTYLDEVYPVPLTFESKTVAVYRETTTDKNAPAIATVLPRLSLGLEAMQYDSQRKTASHNTHLVTNANDGINHMKNGVPYEFTYKLTIMLNKVIEGYRILEQILPYFNPSFNLAVYDGKGVDIKRDMPLTLTGVDIPIKNRYAEAEDRDPFEWTLSFNIKAYLYPPVDVGFTNLIKHIDLNYWEMDKIFDGPPLPLLKTDIDVNPDTAESFEPYICEKAITDFYVHGNTQLDAELLLTNITQIVVISTDQFPDTNGVIIINDEMIMYATKTATTFDTLTRAINNTVAVTHADETGVVGANYAIVQETPVNQ